MFGINVDPNAPKPCPPQQQWPGSESGTKKPELRGMLMNATKTRMVGALGLVVLVAITWRVAVVERRRRAYRQFYLTYDDEADFIRMRQVGVTQSVCEDGSVAGDHGSGEAAD
ncbi:cytochrome c oxidase subunit 6C-2-like [Babylonia areolata]|uniref:cytochrome c oxidase subunit 6C-2-like n=1 Tax=Babylonia areolata TaxID=304850 RepID=UPI003FD40411